MSKNTLEECVIRSLEKYFKDLGEEAPTGIYDMVMQAVERPMLEAVMLQAGHNQSLAAEMLGINRNTLRKKLQQYSLL